MANNRGGLQPTPEERKAWEALGCHKDEVETLIERMERTLATISTSMSSLRRIIKNLEDALNDGQHRSGSRKCSNPRRKPQKSQMPTNGVIAASSHIMKLPSALKTSLSVKATIVMTQS